MQFSDLQIKALSVVESCESQDQLNTAQKYIELFYYRTKDLSFFKYLIVKMNEKIEELNKRG